MTTITIGEGEEKRVSREVKLTDGGRTVLAAAVLRRT